MAAMAPRRCGAEEVRELNHARMVHCKRDTTTELRGFFLLPLRCGTFRNVFACFLTVYCLRMEDFLFLLQMEMDYKLPLMQTKSRISSVLIQSWVSAA